MTISIDSGVFRARATEARDALVRDHLSLVEGIARAIHRGLPSCFDLDDLIGVGNLALTRLATRYRPRQHAGTPFSAFARQGIRGAILDSVRRNKYTEQTRESIHLVPTGVDSEQDSPALMAAATRPVAEERIDARRLARRVSEAISWLTEPQRRVLEAYYSRDEPTLAEVAGGMRLTRRQTQVLHTTALRDVRTRLRRAA